MDSIFHLEDVDRAAFLEQMVQTLGCVYVCLRYYLPPPNNCLKGFDGIYNERSRRRRRNDQQMMSTSDGSLASRLFDVYRDSSAYPSNGLIPGLAFTTNNPYMKLELHEFESLVSNDFQLQFYLEAGIKTIVLMGCATGEIELGFMSDHNPQVDLETEMKNLIRINFPHHHQHQIDPNQPPSSSSSSLRSLSVDSPEYPPFLFNMNPTTTTMTTTPPPPFLDADTALRPVPAPPTTTSQFPSNLINIQFPSIESEDAAMTNAILAVLSTPSTSTSTSTSSHQNYLPPARGRKIIPTAFRRYRPNPAPRFSTPHKHSRFKRSVLFFRNLSSSRSRPEFPVQGNRPTDTQLHHMISERRRRERLNESFHILRSFLPSVTKKDKASVLSSTVEYLSSLKSEVAELKKRNVILESHNINIPKLSSDQIISGAGEAGMGSSSSSGERISVETVQVSSSSEAGARLLELRVRVRGEAGGGSSSLLDLVMNLGEFLKRESHNYNVSLTSVESNTRMLGSVAVHAVVMRLTIIQGDEFDESGFREAVRRNIDDDDDSNF